MNLYNEKTRNKNFNYNLRRFRVQGAINEFKSVLENEGKGFHSVSSWFTSRECPRCHSFEKENRKGLEFKCLACGYQNESDVKAAITIKERFFDNDLRSATKVTVMSILNKRHQMWQGINMLPFQLSSISKIESTELNFS